MIFPAKGRIPIIDLICGDATRRAVRKNRIFFGIALQITGLVVIVPAKGRVPIADLGGCNAARRTAPKNRVGFLPGCAAAGGKGFPARAVIAVKIAAVPAHGARHGVGRIAQANGAVYIQALGGRICTDTDQAIGCDGEVGDGCAGGAAFNAKASFGNS